MHPFDEYPGGGRTRLGRLRNTDNCRHGYGLDLQRKTKQKRCVYCGVDLTHDYYRWLLLNVDHVVPKGEGRRLGIPADMLEDASNKALCCSGCNHFDNHYEIRDVEPREEMAWTDDSFYDLRDRVFEERLHRVARRRAEEVGFFGGKPWEVQ